MKKNKILLIYILLCIISCGYSLKIGDIVEHKISKKIYVIECYLTYDKRLKHLIFVYDKNYKIYVLIKKDLKIIKRSTFPMRYLRLKGGD